MRVSEMNVYVTYESGYKSSGFFLVFTLFKKEMHFEVLSILSFYIAVYGITDLDYCTELYPVGLAGKMIVSMIAHKNSTYIHVRKKKEIYAIPKVHLLKTKNNLLRFVCKIKNHFLCVGIEINNSMKKILFVYRHLTIFYGRGNARLATPIFTKILICKNRTESLILYYQCHSFTI